MDQARVIMTKIYAFAKPEEVELKVGGRAIEYLTTTADVGNRSKSFTRPYSRV